MELQKVALNFMVKSGDRLVKSFLCMAKPPKNLSTKGLKYIPEYSTKTLSAETKSYDFALKRIEFNREKFKQLKDTNIGAEKLQVNKKLFGTIKELLESTQAKTFKKAPNFKIGSMLEEIDTLPNSDDLKRILTKFPNVTKEYIWLMLNIKIPTNNGFRKLTIDEFEKILKSQKTFAKYTRIPEIKERQAIYNIPERTALQGQAPTGEIPRYIYHLTNKQNYLSMLKTGHLKTTPDDYIGRGVFMIDLENFFKFWGKNTAWGDGLLQSKLIRHCLKGEADLVMLKIPTKSLDYNKLSIRSQARAFSLLDGSNIDIVTYVIKDLRNSNLYETDVANAVLRSINRYLDKFSNQTQHIYTGSPSWESKLFSQRKEAIEYIYKEPIDINKATKIGEVNAEEIINQGQPIYQVREIFKTLLSGTPEANGLKNLKC